MPGLSKVLEFLLDDRGTLLAEVVLTTIILGLVAAIVLPLAGL
jgi:hypothetical protein